MDRRVGRSDGQVRRSTGRSDGQAVGRAVGLSGGRTVGLSDCRTVGLSDGRSEVRTVGRTVGRRAGGRSDGRADGRTVGRSGKRALGQAGARAVGQSDGRSRRSGVRAETGAQGSDWRFALLLRHRVCQFGCSQGDLPDRLGTPAIGILSKIAPSEMTRRRALSALTLGKPRRDTKPRPRQRGLADATSHHKLLARRRQLYKLSAEMGRLYLDISPRQGTVVEVEDSCWEAVSGCNFARKRKLDARMPARLDASGSTSDDRKSTLKPQADPDRLGPRGSARRSRSRLSSKDASRMHAQTLF